MLILSKQMNKDLFHPKALSLHPGAFDLNRASDHENGTEKNSNFFNIRTVQILKKIDENLIHSQVVSSENQPLRSKKILYSKFLLFLALDCCNQRKRLPKNITIHNITPLDTKLLFYAKHFLPCDAYFLVELLHGEGLHKC